MSNYSSFEEHHDKVMQELEREIKAGFLRTGSREELEREVGRLYPSRIAGLVKSTHGKDKTRLIHDLGRSGVNSLVACPERVVLPRIIDAIKMALEKILRSHGLPLEWLTLDFSDAFKQLIVSLAERKYLSGRLMRRGSITSQYCLEWYQGLSCGAESRH